MTEQLPCVARADADGDGPPKRTRRPALSCIECRMRKVKCDRNEPCAACIRIKSDKCTYRPTRPGTRRGAEKSPSVSGIHHTSGSLRSSPQSSLPNKQSALGLSVDADSGPLELVTTLLKENERLRSVVAISQTNQEGDIRPISDIITDLPGTFQKSKFFGQSHWMNAMEPYEALGGQNTTVNPSTDRVEVNKSTELYKTVDELKTIGRILKTARMLLPAISPETLSSLPVRKTCDALVDGYLRTFEGVFRVLHVPSFRKEYHGHWSGNGQTKPSILLKIMLVCAIGVPFYTGADQPSLRVASAKWIQAAEAWVAAPHAKSRLNMAGLQIQILILLAKQACNMEGDHVWITAGPVLRTAMYLGLHRDPSYFGKINTFHAEMRRRLWATVLELTVQSSLDMGMPPMIAVQDYDTKPPSNVNDDDLQEQEDLPVYIEPPDVCTDCSIQISFAESLPIRLEIIRQLNNLRFELSYPECLRLGKELTGLCHAKTQFFKDALKNGSKVTPFQVKLFDSLVRRFVLGLHRPFFEKAKDEPQYHFSRKICLDASLAILAPATSPVANVDDDWTLMTYRAVGFFKSLILYAISTVYYELNTQIQEQQETSSLTLPLVSTAPIQQSLKLSSQSQILYDALVSAYHKAVARVRNGETNAKGVVFFACAVARVDAFLAGTDPETSVLKAAKSSIAEMRYILADVYEQEHGESIDLSTSRTRDKEHGRGEGADDVTGQSVQTGTGDGLDRGQTTGVEMGSSLDIGFEMEFGTESQSFSPVDSMDFNFHFLQDPEWFFDTGGWTGTGSDMYLRHILGNANATRLGGFSRQDKSMSEQHELSRMSVSGVVAAPAGRSNMAHHHDDGDEEQYDTSSRLHRRTLLKLDTLLLPFLALLFLFNSLDKSNIGNAESAHFTTDIGLDKADLNTAVALFFAFFVALQPAGAALGRRYGMVAWVPSCMLLWGVSTMLHVWVKQRWQLYLLRIVIGCLEAGFYPVTVSYLSLFYTRFEFGRRLSLFYGQAAVGGALGGIISYVVFNHFPDRHGSKPDVDGDGDGDGGSRWQAWQVLFLLEGGLTVVVALAGYFWLPHSVETAWFLTPDERRYASARVLRDRLAQQGPAASTKHRDSNSFSPTATVDEESRGLLTTAAASLRDSTTTLDDRGLTPRDILSALSSPLIWHLLACNILSAIPVYAFSVFLPLVLAPLTGHKASPSLINLLTAPPHLCGAITLYLFASYSDRHRTRLRPILVGLAIMVTGLTLVVVLPRPWAVPRYISLTILISGAYIASPLTVAWISGNTPSPGKRALMLGINGWGNLAGVISAMLFRPKYADTGYIIPFFWTLVSVALAAGGYVLFLRQLTAKNARRAAIVHEWDTEERDSERTDGTGPLKQDHRFVEGVIRVLRRMPYLLPLAEWCEEATRGGREGDERLTFEYGL